MLLDACRNRLVLKDQLFLVIARMDTPDKAQAALYLAQNGINVYAVCGQFTNELIGCKERFNVEIEILGSAPIKETVSGAIIGDQPDQTTVGDPSPKIIN